MRKEAALIVMVLAYLALRLLDVANIEVPAIDPEVSEGLRELAVLLVSGWLIRRRVFSEHTLEEAGLTPEQVKERAESPLYGPPKIE
jgi:hypothetical protein